VDTDLGIDVETVRGRRADQRWNRMVVGDLLERVTWATPDKVALVGWEGAYAEPRFERMTYREADQAANQVAHALFDEGLAPGDRVLLYCDNSVEAVVLFFGIAKAGMVAVPVNSLLAPDVLAWALEHVEASLVVADAGHLQRGAEVFAAAGTVPRVVIEVGGGDVPPGAVSFGAWLEGRPTSEVDVVVHADDIWALLFTSGTTSMPKASMASHSYSYLAAYSYALSYTRGLAYETDLVIGSFLPIVYHCGHNATVMPAMVSGGTVVIGRRPDDKALAAAITRERVTAVWAGSPQWVHKLIDAAETQPEVDLSSVTVMLYSWGAMAPDLFPRLRAVAGSDVQLVEVFGQTEAMSCFRFWPQAHPDREQETFSGINHVGLPTPILAADIHDADGRSLADRPGEPGEAVYRGPVVSQGYYRDAGATREALRGGWFHSGDSCRYVGGPDRSQVMVDRLKDIVKSGGENVSSARVETILASHPAVARVAVIGVADETWGEVVTAVVVPAPGAILGEAELVAWARERLAGYETPKQIVFAASLPETVGGKVRKHLLRERHR
jgi:acyl-CoA synthetase (AMP-forming)/AMP-acid ligase II